jgi:hypothetical protein
MRNVVLRLLPLFICVPTVWAGDETKGKSQSKEAATPAEQFRDWMSELDKARREANRAYREAQTDEERRKIDDGLRKKLHAYAGRFLEFAERNPKEPLAFDALMFVAINAGAGEEFKKAIDLLLKDHSDKLISLCSVLAERPSAGPEKALRAIVEKTGDHTLAGYASFTLAEILKSKSESTETKPEEVSTLAKEAEALLDGVVKNFADVGGLADQAKEELFVLRNLAIGKTPPDISGEDGDGKNFKMSDYRGKVVVLDFWANW